jgi:hypothetical protein
MAEYDYDWQIAGTANESGHDIVCCIEQSDE